MAGNYNGQDLSGYRWTSRPSSISTWRKASPLGSTRFTFRPTQELRERPEIVNFLLDPEMPAPPAIMRRLRERFDRLRKFMKPELAGRAGTAFAGRYRNKAMKSRSPAAKRPGRRRSRPRFSSKGDSDSGLWN